MVEYLRVFCHVGFFCIRSSGIAATTKREPWIISKGKLIMYIGGGLLTVVIVVVLVMFVLRR